MFVSSLLGAKLGAAITWPLMGLITEIFNWQCALYVTAFLSFVVSIVWFQIVADSPDKHPEISISEREYIEDSLEQVISKSQDLPPVVMMMRSRPFYAFLFLHFSDVWGVFFLLTSAPMFMSQVLKFDLKHSGLMSSIPYIARMISGFIFGLIGDNFIKKGVSPTQIRKTFCIFCKIPRCLLSELSLISFFSAHIIPGLFLFGFCFVDQNPYVCIALITLSLGFNGAATITSGQNAQDLAPNFAASVFGIANFFATMSGFISPMVVSYFTHEKVCRHVIP